MKTHNQLTYGRSFSLLCFLLSFVFSTGFSVFSSSATPSFQAWTTDPLNSPIFFFQPILSSSSRLPFSAFSRAKLFENSLSPFSQASLHSMQPANPSNFLSLFPLQTSPLRLPYSFPSSNFPQPLREIPPIFLSLQENPFFYSPFLCFKK